MQFFFNQLQGEVKLRDEGLEFATVIEARIEAVRYAAEVMRDDPKVIWTGQDFRIEVTNADKLVLFTVVIVGVDAPAAPART